MILEITQTQNENRRNRTDNHIKWQVVDTNIIKFKNETSKLKIISYF